MKDFTWRSYRLLLDSLKKEGYEFTSLEHYLQHQPEQKKVVILRHDVDKRPGYSLHAAGIEHNLGITGTYYFRIVRQSFQEDIIRRIAAMGHEIGYHYEDLALTHGNITRALAGFEKHLKRFEGLYKVKTICMHGSPMSRYDNRAMWEHADYHKFGLLGEPYFDLDFSKILYLTDTGRRWDGGMVSVRDKERVSEQAPLSGSYHFHTSFEIVEAAHQGFLPNQIMLNFHPQRWTDHPVAWSMEEIEQQLKNRVKMILVKRQLSLGGS